MRAAQWRWPGAMMFALAACSPQPTTPPGSGATPTVGGPSQALEAWISGEAEGSDEAQACAAAQYELARTLLGDARWLPLYGVSLHGPEDPRRVQPSPTGTVHCAVGLSRSGAAAVISQVEMGQPTIAGPAAWRDVLFAFVTAQAAAHVCRRRRALFDSTCEPGETGEADAALAALAGSVRLLAQPSGGPVVAGDGTLLVVPSCLVLWNDVPTAQVPVVVQGGPAENVRAENVRSDNGGRVVLDVAMGEPMPPGASVALDVDALLGPLADAWQTSPVKLDARPLALSRWALVQDSTRAGDSLGETLAAQGLGPPQALAKRAAAEIASASTDRRDVALRRAAAEARGDLDYIVVAETEAAFASRMGGGRVWYEARGSLMLFEAWSGTPITTVQTKVRAADVGDAAAERAARVALSRALARALKTAEGVVWPAAPNR